MRPRSLLLSLFLAVGFWYATSHGDWTLRQLLQPISRSGKLWSDPVTAHGSGFGSDEQNNIDIYKTNRLATVNITSIVYQRDFFFQVFPQRALVPASSSTPMATSSPIITSFPVPGT